MTVREALAAGRANLAAAGVETPSLDASLLLAEALGVGRSSLVATAGDSLGEAPLAAFGTFIKRRTEGECVAYILGRKEFYGLEFNVNDCVLVPRPDTETLVEVALARLSRLGQPQRMLDLCTGSGAVAVAIKHKMPGLEVWATDVSPKALEIAETNAKRLSPLGASPIRFRCGDLFEALSDRERPLFHLITGNPPYVPSGEIASLAPEVRAEPALALDGGTDGLDVIRNIVLRATDFLYQDGTLMLEADPRQMPEIALLLAKAGFTDVQTHADLSGALRVIAGRKGGQGTAE